MTDNKSPIEMSAKPPFDPDELIVKSQYFRPVEHSEEVLSNIKQFLGEKLVKDGYRPVDVEFNALKPVSRTITFQYDVLEPKLPLKFRIRKGLNLLSDAEEMRVRTEGVMEQISLKRPDIPFEITFDFWAITLEGGEEGYEVEVVARPMLLQQYQNQMLDPECEYDIRTAVDTTKRYIEKYVKELRPKVFRSPYTEAELLDSVLPTEYRDILRETEYGRYLLQYLDEGDMCFKRKNLNAALSCYIHAIEWVVLRFGNKMKPQYPMQPVSTTSTGFSQCSQ